MGINTEKSVLGWQWELASGGQGSLLAQKLGVADVIGRVLNVRQPTLSVEEAFAFLSPQLSHLPDPMHLLDMDKAVERLKQALQNKEKIAVFGDYDVDGACSSALLLRYFDTLGVDATLYIPHRLTEGYGPNPQAMEKLKAEGVQLIVTVDCGSTAHPALEKAEALGMDVVVTDHHQCPAPFPPCVALVNPNRVDEMSPATMLCGAGVAFYVLMALNRTLREEGYFTEECREPDLRQWLDLVAVATIADIVPLTGANRVLVQRGLQMLNRFQNTGLRALTHIAGCSDAMGTYQVGFQLGPRLNAAGRLAEPDLGARLLRTESEEEAFHIAQRLDRLNQERRALQEEVLEEALKQAEKQADEPAIVVSGKDWHPGVVGIVAARLKERFYRPALVLAVGEDGSATGSGRSILGVDLGRAIAACQSLIERGGGHAMAAGVTVREDQIPAFGEAFKEQVERQIKGKADIFIPKLRVDGLLQPMSVTGNLLEQLQRLEPYGTSHGEPMFAFSGVILRDVRTVGADGRHVKIRMGGADGQNMDGIVFGAMDNALGPFLQQNRGKKVTLAGNVRVNTFGGQNKPDLQVKDAFAGVWKSL